MALMLKDYLKDDLSSCSSSGFKSFPRRQCCTTVRFLLEIDLTKSSNAKQQLLQQQRRRSAKNRSFSCLQRASGALLSAVKLLPFPSLRSPSVKQRNKTYKALTTLPRSLSRKLLKRSFWMRSSSKDHHDHHQEDEQTIRRLRMFREYLEDQQPSDQSKVNIGSASDITPRRISVSTSSTESNSWAESDFTADVLQSSSGNSYSENDAVESSKMSLPISSVIEKPSSGIVGVSAGEDSITNSEDNRKEWRSEEEKEQFSPVSVLDGPFEDEQNSQSPPFKHRLARMEGTRKLEPVDLEKRLSSIEVNHEPSESSCNETDEKVQELLSKLKDSTTTTAENLLSDFFRERIGETEGDGGLFLLKEAGDWANGEPRELMLGWEVKEGRKAYVKDMESDVRWMSVVQGKEEVGLSLQTEIFDWLVDDLVLDLL